MKEQGEAPLFPPSPLPHLVDWFFEVGPTMPGPAGEIPITFGNVNDWGRAVEHKPEPWEARALVRMSKKYTTERFAARKVDCPAPYSGNREEIVSRRGLVDRKVRTLFAGLTGKKG